MNRLRNPLLLLAVLALGAGLRIGYLREARRDAVALLPLQDAEYNHYWARGLATGNWTLPPLTPDPRIADTPYFRPPGYAWFLALIYRLGSPRPAVAAAVQMALGLVNVVLAFLLARRWLGSGPALWTALLLAGYWLFPVFETALLDPTLHLTLLLAAFLLLERGDRTAAWPWMGLAGLVFGLAALVRPNTLLFVPCAAAWCAWPRGAGGPGPRSRWTAAGALALGVTLAVAPVTLRNLAVGHDRVLISSNGGLMLYMGNSEPASGLTGTQGLNNLLRGKYRSCFDYPLLVDDLGGQLGRRLKPSEASALLAAAARREACSDPARFLALTWKKVLLFWGPAEWGHNNEPAAQRQSSPLLRRMPGNFPALLALFLVGCAAGWRQRAAAPGAAQPASRLGTLVLLFIPVYFLSLLPFVFSSQYRLALLPFLMMPAGLTLHRVAESLRRGRSAAAAGLLLAAAACYVVLRVNYSGLALGPAAWFYQRAALYERLGRHPQALAEYDRALQADPGHAWAQAGRGIVLARLGRLAEAETALRRALELEPDFPRARVNLAYARHIRGDTQRAVAEIEAVLAEDPRNLAALNALAWIRATHADPRWRDGAAAVRAAETACVLTQGRDAECLDTLAAAEAETGAFEHAVAAAQQALRRAEEAGAADLARQIGQRLELYRRGQPYHERRPAAAP